MLLAALATIGVNRILFSVDYPFSTNKQGRAFLISINLPPTDVEKIAHVNADRLLNLQAWSAQLPIRGAFFSLRHPRYSLSSSQSSA